MADIIGMIQEFFNSLVELITGFFENIFGGLLG